MICCNRFVYGMLRRSLPEDKVELIEGLTLTADKTGAVFDVAQSDLDLFIAAGQKSAGSMSLEVVKELPKLQEREPLPQRRYGRNAGGGNRFGGGGGNRFGGGGGRGRGGGRGQRY